MTNGSWPVPVKGISPPFFLRNICRFREIPGPPHTDCSLEVYSKFKMIFRYRSFEGHNKTVILEDHYPFYEYPLFWLILSFFYFYSSCPVQQWGSRIAIWMPLLCQRFFCNETRRLGNLWTNGQLKQGRQTTTIQAIGSVFR